MTSFRKLYRTIYETFGAPLDERTACLSSAIASAEKRLGVRIPAALRDYALVAGKERRFNTCHNRWLPPEAWSIDRQRLIFMEENQSVVLWGASVRNPATVDPPVSQSVNEEPLRWYREHRRLSEFLAVMLHYQAVNGGMRRCAIATAMEQPEYCFEHHGWTRYGPVNGLLAYSRPNQVVCLMPPSSASIVRSWSLLAGARTKSGLKNLQDEMRIEWE